MIATVNLIVRVLIRPTTPYCTLLHDHACTYNNNNTNTLCISVLWGRTVAKRTWAEHFSVCSTHDRFPSCWCCGIQSSVGWGPVKRRGLPWRTVSPLSTHISTRRLRYPHHFSSEARGDQGVNDDCN